MDSWFVPFVFAMIGLVVMLVCVFMLAAELRKERKRRKDDRVRMESEALSASATSAARMTEICERGRKEALQQKIADALDIYTRLGQPISNELMIFTVLYNSRPGRKEEVRTSLAFVQEEPYKAVAWYRSNVGPLPESELILLGVK